MNTKTIEFHRGDMKYSLELWEADNIRWLSGDSSWVCIPQWIVSCLRRHSREAFIFRSKSGSFAAAVNFSRVDTNHIQDIMGHSGADQTGCPSLGGRLLFAATSKGSIRAYRLPLGAECQELHCSTSPITQLALSQDYNSLFASNAEGLLFVFSVKDRDPSRYCGAPCTGPV
jgi:WD40 repeat protein